MKSVITKVTLSVLTVLILISSFGTVSAEAKAYKTASDFIGYVRYSTFDSNSSMTWRELEKTQLNNSKWYYAKRKDVDGMSSDGYIHNVTLVAYVRTIENPDRATRVVFRFTAFPNEEYDDYLVDSITFGYQTIRDYDQIHTFLDKIAQ